ncbi:hypothetical protein DH2020_034687 [Rehmannia glutinosa]|uniref:Uncharacterized protein n=1 Tax=Rehmannia glutinosa TaxID=99300 RepID=A0ABR0VBQ8_REHGL
MGLTKKSQHQLSAVAKGPNTKKGVENLPRKSREPVNHWAILDEIEAPMWADLTLECDSNYDNKFHQCSARHLISTSSHSGKHCMKPSSSKPPSLVSKSRGEDYLNAGSEKENKNNVLDGKVYEPLDYMSDAVDESTLAGTTASVFSKLVSNFSSKNSFAKSVVIGGDSNSTSRSFGYSSGLLSNLRDSIRKSYVTRQASRVEIKGSRQSGRRISSSSKSSVGSSLHPGCGGMSSMVTENMDKTPDSRSILTMCQLPTDQVNRANLRKAPAARARNMSCKSDLRIKKVASETMDHKKRTEGCVTRGVNKRVPLTTAKYSTRARGINPSGRTVDGGKENQSGKMALTIKSSMRIKEAERHLNDQKVVKKKVHQTSDRTKLVGQRFAMSLAGDQEVINSFPVPFEN